MAQMDFKALFYGQSHDRESLIKDLDGLLHTEPHILSIIPYASERSPAECFKAFDSNRRFSCISNERGVTVLDLFFHSPWEESDVPAVEGRFFVYEHQASPNTYVLLTVESQEFIQRALLPFIERSYPRIYLTLISQNRLSLLLHDFKEKYGFTDLIVRRASLRSRFAGEKTRREAIIPSESWPNLGLEGAFDFAREQNGWFKSLTFEAWTKLRLDAEITVTRSGVMKTDRQFLKVFDGLIAPICELVHDNHELFRNRSRRDSVSLEVRPLTINFRRDQLADEEERAKLVEAMRLLNKASMSVVHSNPYLQLSVIDYLDGSTFDLWVLNPRELIIVPQLKGTVSSIRRLVSHVFDNYAEGYIEDFQAVG
jgi:hypothetical protein